MFGGSFDLAILSGPLDLLTASTAVLVVWCDYRCLRVEGRHPVGSA
ncbi:MAG: hypothetical protein GDA36_07095 [Rhodobacteraceae bacterium]|nr:hypothetical protein [Paracoccaceae bacterium]